MKQHPDTDYLFLSSSLHAREARGSREENRAETLRELRRLAPDSRIVDYFSLKYDYHNAKVLLKSSVAHCDAARLLSPLGRVSPERLTAACQEDRGAGVPEPLAKALSEAKALLADSGDPRLSDCLLDKAYVAELLETARATGLPLLVQYTELLIDTLNLRALLRMRKSAVPTAQLGGILHAGGRVTPRQLQAAYPDLGPLLKLYGATALAPALPEAEKADEGGGFAPFETICRRLLNDKMGEAKQVCFGAPVLIRYLYAWEGAPV